ncbi:MAG: hypothetical protein HOO99_08085 [Hyphomicrobiaceae bacterium]|nr:hypothetical protein [Hyphomicrobiaceae bacterium]
MTPTSFSLAFPRLLRQLRAISLHTTLALAFAVTLVLAVTVHHFAATTPRAIQRQHMTVATEQHDAYTRSSERLHHAPHIAQSNIVNALTVSRILPASEATERQLINTAARQDSTNQASTNLKRTRKTLDQPTITIRALLLDPNDRTSADGTNAHPLSAVQGFLIRKPVRAAAIVGVLQT